MRSSALTIGARFFGSSKRWLTARAQKPLASRTSEALRRNRLVEVVSRASNGLNYFVPVGRGTGKWHGGRESQNVMRRKRCR